MPNFAHYFNSNFRGCREIANGRDIHRNRDVRIFMIPGEVDCVGVTDGVDKWIAPVIAEPFNLPLGRIIADIHAGKSMKLPFVAGGAVKRARRSLIEDPPINPPPDEPEPLQRRPSKPQPRVRRQLEN